MIQGSRLKRKRRNNQHKRELIVGNRRVSVRILICQATQVLLITNLQLQVQSTLIEVVVAEVNRTVQAKLTPLSNQKRPWK